MQLSAHCILFDLSMESGLYWKPFLVIGGNRFSASNRISQRRSLRPSSTISAWTHLPLKSCHEHEHWGQEMEEGFIGKRDEQYSPQL